MPARQFRYSIVMSVYNVEPYIDEAVQSLLSQSIGFSENVQTVFVNDGSSDNSGEICKGYCSHYPENMVYIEQENKGLVAARNVGVKVASGSYINFFDLDDILSPNAIEEVGKFFAFHGMEIGFVTIPLVYFEGQKGIHGKYKMMGKKNRVIDLLEQPACFILSSAGSFYKAEVFETNQYDEELGNCEDAKFNMAPMKACPRFGYVCENGVKCHYRRRATGGLIPTSKGNLLLLNCFETMCCCWIAFLQIKRNCLSTSRNLPPTCLGLRSRMLRRRRRSILLV